MEAIAETQRVLVVDNNLERIELLNNVVVKSDRYSVIAQVQLKHGLIERVKQVKSRYHLNM